MDYTKEKRIFDEARRHYPGVKRGLDTEFDSFRKKHKDWKSVLLLLSPAIKQQTERRGIDTLAGRFVPPWKYFKTWLYNRCWEETVGVIETPEEKKAKAKRQREKEEEKIREDWQDYLESKTTQALKDIKKDGGHLMGVCGWLINEILATR